MNRDSFLNLTAMLAKSGHATTAADGTARMLARGAIDVDTFDAATEIIKSTTIKMMQDYNRKMRHAPKMHKQVYNDKAMQCVTILHKLGMTLKEIEAVEFAS